MTGKKKEVKKKADFPPNPSKKMGPVFGRVRLGKEKAAKMIAEHGFFLVEKTDQGYFLEGDEAAFKSLKGQK